MIERIHLQNFQSHKNTTLEFSPGVNVILGQSDSGKSAVIRALEWVRTNKPGGEAFRSHWGGDTAVTVTTEGANIKRAKGKEKTGGNHYKLESTVFKAMGQKVPEEITDVLALTDVNTQAQHHTPFLLSESAGEVARRMNQVANLVVIDESQAHLSRLARNTGGTIKHLRESLEQSKGSLSELSHLGEVRRALNEIQGVSDEHTRIQHQVALLSRAITTLRRETEALARVPDISGCSQDLADLEDLNRQIANTTASLQKLKRAVQTVAHEMDSAEKTKEAYNELRAKFNSRMPKECPLCGTLSEK